MRPAASIIRTFLTEQARHDDTLPKKNGPESRRWRTSSGPKVQSQSEGGTAASLTKVWREFVEKENGMVSGVTDFLGFHL